MMGFMWAISASVNVGLGMTIGGVFNIAIAVFCGLMAIYSWMAES